jgi:hypothetical protein
MRAKRTERQLERDREAFAAFRGSARKMRPTMQHRAALWENMLGTVYAANADGEVKYFDYDYAEALAWVGAADDVRVSRLKPGDRLYVSSVGEGEYGRPRVGQWVWFVKQGVK